ncbi:MAG: glycerol-3-phosphate 1-O-acyltransferase PlsY [Tissierellia bacterium]|nr:glycerol-3-phosphate 1-O-acyltransferase PlsY [Tissierellia bacterium]
MGLKILVVIISYLIGSFSSAYVLGKLIKKADIRTYGSGNAGATNALRVFGKRIGAMVFILDVLKGILAAYIGGKLIGYDGRLLGGFFAVVGHMWPIFLKFKGGKGIATSFGMLLSIHWPTAIITLIGFIIVLLVSKYVSLASIFSCVAAPIVIALVTEPFDRKFFIATLIIAIISIIKHRSNIVRLLNGQEYKIGEKVRR